MAKNGKIKFVINVFASKFSLLLLGSLTIWLGYSVIKEAYIKHQVQSEIESLRQEIIELEGRNSGLSSLINSFEDPGNIELEAKRRLNLKKPGEEVAVILRSGDNADQNIVQAAYTPQQDMVDVSQEFNSDALVNPLKWWQYITNTRD